MRLLRLLVMVAGVVGVALAVRALLAQDREPASLDTWPPVPRKPAGEASAA